MSQQIYMSVQAGRRGDDRRVYDLPANCNFRHRGEASGPSDDPQGFKRRMADRGFMVVITDVVVGEIDPAAETTIQRGVRIATAADLGLAVENGVIVP